MNTIQDTTKQQAEVMLAFVEGKDIEYETRGLPRKWQSASVPCWNWSMYNYRVKKEPRTFYVVLRGNGTPCRAFNDRQSATDEASSLNSYSAHGPYSVVETTEVLKED